MPHATPTLRHPHRESLRGPPALRVVRLTHPDGSDDGPGWGRSCPVRCPPDVVNDVSNSDTFTPKEQAAWSATRRELGDQGRSSCGSGWAVAVDDGDGAAGGHCGAGRGPVQGRCRPGLREAAGAATSVAGLGRAGSQLQLVDDARAELCRRATSGSRDTRYIARVRGRDASRDTNWC